MNYKKLNRIIEAISQGKNLFIKNTGIQISVDYFGSDANDYRDNFKDRRCFCNIEFVTIPTTSCLKLLKNYHIKKNSHTKKMELSGVIDIEHLSLLPHESKAGKLLYGKKNK